MEKIPGNYSTIENPDSRLEHVGENKYKDNQDKEYYELRKSPEIQFIVSQLAAMVIPIASVYKEGSSFYSQSVADHPDYKEFPVHSYKSRTMSRKERESYNPAEEDKYFMSLIFEDTDHTSTANSAGSVLFDFDGATIDRDHLTDDKFGIETTLGYLDRNNPTVSTLVRQKVQKFKSLIQGEEGLDFLSALVHKSGYTGSAENIQKKLLSRCDLVLNL